MKPRVSLNGPADFSGPCRIEFPIDQRGNLEFFHGSSHGSESFIWENNAFRA